MNLEPVPTARHSIYNYSTAVLKSRRIGDPEWQDGNNGNAQYTLNWEYIVGALTKQPLSYVPFTWQSSDESVLTVSSFKDDTTLVLPYSGGTHRASLAVVQCVGEGTATITVANPKYDGISAQRTYTVLRYDPTGITASVASTTLRVGESGIVNVQTIPAATSYPADLLECTFASSDPAVLGVDATGRFTALAKGSAYITVTYGTLNATTETITVPAVEPTDIVINEDEGETIDLYEGEIFQLTATVLPDNATDKTVTWESSNTAVATVDANGLVTAVSGTKSGRWVRITAKTVNDRRTYIRFNIKTAPEEPIYYTVTFKDWDETVLKEEQVLRGQAATPPADPVREGYTFTGWDKDFSNVQSDLTVTALYEQNAQNDAITVRLNPSSAPTWSNVYLYSWYDGGAVQPCGAWPGLQVNKDSNGWWSYTFDSNIKSVNIIWNNGTGEQTIDITDVTQSTCYDLDTDVYPYGVFVIDCSKNPTALEDVQSNSTPKAHKVIKNNTLYIILPDGSKYSATGQKL